MKAHWVRAILSIGLAVGLVACQKERWQAGENVRARDVDVAAALGDTSEANSGGLAASDIPVIAYPKALRPVPAAAIQKYGRIQLATVLAQWVAYQSSRQAARSAPCPTLLL